MKTRFDVYETNADNLILLARDEDGSIFAAADRAEQIAGYVDEIKNGETAASLAAYYGSDEDAENDDVSDLNIILDEVKSYGAQGSAGQICLTLLHPEEANFNEIIEICNHELIPFSWRSYSKEDIFDALFKTAVFNLNDDQDPIESAERAAYYAGGAAGVLENVDIHTADGKIYIHLSHRTTKTANSAAISESIVFFFTCDFSYHREAYEQHEENEYIVLSK